MVASIFILIVMGVALGWLGYLYVKSLKQLTHANEQAKQTESELQALQVADVKLRHELTQAQEQLHRISQDSVTKLLGWQLFEDRLTQAIKESDRYQLTMGVLFVDIDDFKVINDGLDYEVGDILLTEVAARLQTCIRQVDSISRFTKDTFVILLAQLSKPETAAVVATRILQALTPSFQIKGHELYITACIGIATFPTDGKDAPSLLRSGDHALHLAKEKGHHQYQFYQERMHERSQRELAIYTSLSRECILSEFVLYYQPMVNVKNKTLMGMDVLLNWQHSEFGTLASEELLSMVEKQRKANVVSEWLLRTACKQFLHWQSLGFTPPLLGIPLSIKQLENSHFIYRLQQVLQELQFKPELLLLEIREGHTELSFDVLEKAFNMLKYLGVKIAMDHFGTGLFSLRHLKNFAVSYLKLDPYLIEGIELENSQQAQALIKALLLLAESMSMQAVVQGIESEAQKIVLESLGYELMQGRLISQPLTEAEVVKQYAVTQPS